MNIYRDLPIVSCIGPACENQEIIEALYKVYREARGCAYMSGFREFAGNTNTKCLRDRIEAVDKLLPGLSPKEDSGDA